MATAIYLAALSVLVLVAAHRLALVVLYYRRGPRPAPSAAALAPIVTVQLPIYNEALVAERLLEAAAAIRWPAGRLEIQVIDDSTDETVAVVERTVAALVARGADVKHLRRGERSGFKAGALAHGLATARGELVAVFDADFVPPPDVLERTVAWFADPAVGMVQARWGHLNRGQSLLTDAQALLLDGHFVIEHGARARAGCFFNFSGTAGVWRKATIDDAGGWQSDTLTEDMDLSVRAQLAGWRFVFVPDVVVPAELPACMDALKSQQFRWAKGQMQVARKLCGAVRRAPLSLWKKLDALAHLTSNAAYLFLLVACLALPWTVGEGFPAGALCLSVGSAAMAGFYGVARREIGQGALGAVWRAPLLMALCAGLSWSQSRAVVEALAGRPSAFVRTPKTGARSRRQPGRRRYRAASGSFVAELALAAYLGAGAVAAALAAAWATLPFLLLFAAGFAVVGGASLRARLG